MPVAPRRWVALAFFRVEILHARVRALRWETSPVRSCLVLDLAAAAVREYFEAFEWAFVRCFGLQEELLKQVGLCCRRDI